MSTKYHPDEGKPPKYSKIAKEHYEDDHGPHRTQNTSSDFQQDQDLRNICGFEIFARPNNKEAVWIKDKEFYTQTQAVEYLRKVIEAHERHDK